MFVGRSPWHLTPGDVGQLIHSRIGPVFVERVVWTNYTDPTHRLRITSARLINENDPTMGRENVDFVDTDGSLEFENVTIDVDGGWVFNPFLAQLDSGDCFIYIR